MGGYFEKVEGEAQVAMLTSSEPQMCVQLNPDIPKHIRVAILKNFHIYLQYDAEDAPRGVLCGIFKSEEFTDKELAYQQAFWAEGVDALTIGYITEPVEGFIVNPNLPESHLVNTRRTFDVAKVDIGGQEREVIKVFFKDVTS